MNYQLIQKDDVNKNVNLTLTLGMVKILHNACVDVLRTLPEYPKTAYAFALEELEEIISNPKSETITGVLTIPSKEPRTIGDIYYELSNHPDFVAGSYYDKETIIEQIVYEIENEYPDDNNEPGMYDIIYKDAEQILNNNFRKIVNNIDGCYDYGMDSCIFTEGCNLTLEKQTK